MGREEWEERETGGGVVERKRNMSRRGMNEHREGKNRGDFNRSYRAADDGGWQGWATVDGAVRECNWAMLTVARRVVGCCQVLRCRGECMGGLGRIVS